MATIGGAKATLVNKINSLTTNATAKDTIYLAKALKENTTLSNFTFEGAWAATTEYTLDDVVTNGGNTYICIAAHTSGASFSVGSNWTMMAAAGSTVGTGTAGQVLKTNAAGNGIEWGAVSSEGRLVKRYYHPWTTKTINNTTSWVTASGSNFTYTPAAADNTIIIKAAINVGGAMNGGGAKYMGITARIDTGNTSSGETKMFVRNDDGVFFEQSERLPIEMQLTSGTNPLAVQLQFNSHAGSNVNNVAINYWDGSHGGISYITVEEYQGVIL